MHDSSWEKMAWFVDEYLGRQRDADLEVLDVGSQIVSASHRTYRTLFDSPRWRYTGLDISEGLNVDVAVAELYRWTEVPADHFDVVVSGQALEHIEWFWLTILEIERVLKPGGITMLIAPSSGPEHRYPQDCWRFYPDGMRAMAEFAGCEVLDAGTDWQRKPWADSYLVMRKPVAPADRGPRWTVRQEVRSGAGADATPSVLSDAVPGRVSERLAASTAAGASATVAPPLRASDAGVAASVPVPSADGAGAAVRRVVRRLAGGRLLAVYRAARYGHSHP